jgi:hypothetical protein
VAEGALKLEDGKLVLTAKEVRIRDDAGKDKEFAKGTAIVEGKAIHGKFEYSKGEESKLAINAGSGVIVVAGELTKEQAELQGIVQASGKLRIEGKGVIVIRAEKLDAVQKDR